MNKEYNIQSEHERNDWNEKFSHEILNFNKDKIYSSYRRELYYKDMKDYIIKLIQPRELKDISMIEVGSGSGKASLNLKPNKLTLVDISYQALNFAELINNNRYNIDNINFVNKDFLTLHTTHKYNIVLNIGMLEHYSDETIIKMIKKMFVLCDEGGYVIFGLPNKLSGPILKANFLSTKLGRLFPGYRLGSERFFSNRKIINLIKISLNGENFETKVEYVGSPMIMEGSKYLIKMSNNKLLKRFRFLKFYSIKKT